MLNEVRLEGTLSDGYQDQPAVRCIEKDGKVKGYACQIEFRSARGRAFVGLTHWSADSPLQHAQVGDAVVVKGALIQEAWKTDADDWRRKLALEVERVQIPRLYAQQPAASAPAPEAA